MQGIGTGGVNLSKITTFLFDLDGILWRGDTAITEAIDTVNQLREDGYNCLFCTNNSSKTKAHFTQKMEEMGIPIREDELFTSSWVAAHYLSAQFTGPFLAYVVGEKGIRTELSKIGARVVPDSDIEKTTKVDCVVVGIDRSFNYQKLTNAQQLILGGALFIATNRDGSYPVADGVHPGGGTVVAAVEAATGITPVTVGKPRPVMVDLAIEKLGVSRDEVAFVGDRLDTDIACARRAGIAAICVTTGVTSLEKAQHARGELQPHLIYENLPALYQDIQEAKSAPPVEESETQQMAAEEETASIETSEQELPSHSEDASQFDFTTPEETDIPTEAPAEEAVETKATETETVEEETEEEEDTSWTEDLDKLFDEVEAQEEPAPDSEDASADDQADQADKKGNSFNWKLD